MRIFLRAYEQKHRKFGIWKSKNLERLYFWTTLFQGSILGCGKICEGDCQLDGNESRLKWSFRITATTKSIVAWQVFVQTVV